MEERLQKIIAMAGLASRRHAEQMILAGEVTVNGKIVDMLGVRADPESDHIKVRGRLINPLLQTREKVHILLNKPKGYLSSVADPDRRPLVTDLMPEALGRLYPVGRLDFNTEGLLILTNDGDLTNFVTAARNNVEKVYEAKVKGLPPEPAIERLRRGIILEDGVRTKPAEIEHLESTDSNAWFRITLHEGRNQQIRMMFEAIGHSVVKLRRVQIGFLRDDKLPVGKWRMLSPIEVKMLMTKKPRERKNASKLSATSAVKNSSATAARSRSEPGALRYSKPSSRPDGRAPLKSSAKSHVRPASESTSRHSSRPNTRPGSKAAARPGGRPGDKPLSASPAVSGRAEGSTQSGRRPGDKSWGRSEPNSSSRPTSRSTGRPGLKSTSRQNTGPNARPFVKEYERSESESNSRPSSRPSRPGSKTSARPGGRPDNKSWGKSGSESSSRPSSRPNRRPGLKSTARPNTRPEEGSFAKKPEKFELESASRPISRPNSRPGSKSFAGPSGRTKAGPGTKRKTSSKTRPAGHGKGRS